LFYLGLFYGHTLLLMHFVVPFSAVLFNSCSAYSHCYCCCLCIERVDWNRNQNRTPCSLACVRACV